MITLEGRKRTIGEILDEANAALDAPSPASVAPGDAQAVAWMDPETLDVISAERKAAWLSNYGIGGANKAARYTRALGDFRPAPAAGDALDAARWRFVRRKLFLTGNGDGTCGMHAINLPASIPGWPEPGAAVAEFCDAAIDAAIAAQQGKGGEA